MSAPPPVLVVDDRPADRLVLRRLLEQRGHRVVEAADGAEALHLVTIERPAVVVSDIVLPVVGGYELLLRLRDVPAAAGVPVVLCSAHFGPWETAGVAEALGAAAVLGKPVEADALYRVIDDSLAGANGAGKPPAAASAVPAELIDLLTGKLFEKVQQLEVLSGDRQALLGALVCSQEDERGRIAAALHDDAVQVLFGAALMLQALAGGEPDPERAATIRDIAGGLTGAGDRLRRLMNDLQPPTSDHQSLTAVLARAVARAAAAGGFSATLDGSLPEDPSPDQFTVLYRITQEALANTVRHAGASEVSVSVAARDGGVLVRVHDDGAGLPAGGLPPGKPYLGLTAMRERAELAGGWWRIRSQPPAPGTLVEFWIPLDAGR